MRIEHGHESLCDQVPFGMCDGIAPREVDMVGHDAEGPDLESRVQSTDRIGGNKRIDASGLHRPYRQRDILRAHAFIAMQTPLHAEHPYLRARDPSEHEAPLMASCR